MEREQLSLRRFDYVRDLVSFYSWEQDSALSMSLEDEPIGDLAQLGRYLRSLGEEDLSREQGLLRVLSLNHEEEEVAIGYVQLYSYSERNRRAEVSIFIAKEYRGQQRARRGLELLIRWAQDRYAIRHFVARVLERNSKSQQMLLALGFEHTATLPHWHKVGEHYQSLMYYQLWIGQEKN